MTAESSPADRTLLPAYRAVWRWHFYASLFCMPFVIVLSLTGALYLFKPQFEDWCERPYESLEVKVRKPVSDQIAAVLAAMPGATLQSYELPRTPSSASRILVRQKGEAIRVYMHPEKLEVLHQVQDNQRFMKQMFRLHGELWMGDRGSNVVETAASWTIIMILTGLYLWWPRHLRGLGGVLYPRLFGGKKMFWRDLHSVTGIWISGLVLVLLLSGLPWAKFWGDYFKRVRALTGTATARQDWNNSSRAKNDEGGGEHASHRGKAKAGNTPKYDLKTIDQVAATVSPLQLEYPVLIAPPSKADGKWTAKSMTPNRPWRVNLEIDGATGEILSRDGFEDRHWLDKVTAVGTAMHEGQLFGWANQLLGLFAALGLVLLTVSGTVLWLRRKKPGVLGAPSSPVKPRIPWLIWGLVLLLGLYLPLFAATLVLVLILEWFVLRRISTVRDWLGLPAPVKQAVVTKLAAPMMLFFILAPAIGCGPQPVTGGTKGVLQSGKELFSDIHIDVYRVEGSASTLIGFGETNREGAFELYLNGAKGPLNLSPGEYRFTLSSSGAPVAIPAEYTKPESTPLITSWKNDGAPLRLEAPIRLLP